jgi:hypothetical protein
MFLLLSAVLAAAPPLHLIAVHGPQSAEALTRLTSLPSVTTIDASALHEYLLRTEGQFPMQDFDGFSAPPVKEWSPAAADTWTKGVAHCRTLVGEPPFKELGAALSCANRLSAYLWQQYAAQQKATRVFEIDVSIDERKGRARVRGSAWEPSSRDQLFLDEGGTLAQLPQTMDLVLNALIQKKGATQARNVVAELESATLGDPFSAEVAATSPLTLKKSCTTLPARITITPASVLSKSLAARWAPAGAKGPEQPCTLTFSEHTERVGAPTSVVTTLLTCSSTIISTEISKVATGSRSSVDLASEQLLQGLATKLCSGRR